MNIRNYFFHFSSRLLLLFREFWIRHILLKINISHISITYYVLELYARVIEYLLHLHTVRDCFSVVLSCQLFCWKVPVYLRGALRVNVQVMKWRECSRLRPNKRAYIQHVLQHNYGEHMHCLTDRYLYNI